MKIATLWILIENGQIFLWEKKRGFAKWVLNWFGWKIENCESIDECMIRETKEEIWINIEEMEKVWINHFYFEETPEWNMEVHIYMVYKYNWEIVESNEIKPLWFDLEKIPYDKMWADDIYWLPRILNWEKDIEYKFWFDKDDWKIIKQELIK